MKILVTGGAGYIGSFMAKGLLDRGDDVVVVDNLENGHQEVVDTRAQFIKGDLREKEFVDSLFQNNKFDAVIHFAAYIAVGESMSKPYKYFYNNVIVGLNLLNAMKENNQNNLIFSSTAATYGEPKEVPIKEDHVKNPTNPYGESKLMVEKLLKWYAEIHGINSVALRYFNASGGALDGSMGENHVMEVHIIPNIIRAVLNETEFTLFGNDFDTPDGSCVRDYIHVLDLVQAHMLALQKLQNEKGHFAYNVGTGVGHSNKEVVEMVKKVSGKDVKVVEKDRRPGDPGTLIADPTKIKTELHFDPKYSDLETVIKSAWEWHSRK
jgi:UDP-glucose 4-epimerase